MLTVDQNRLLHYCLDNPLDTQRWGPYADSLLDDPRYEKHATMIHQVMEISLAAKPLWGTDQYWGKINYEVEEIHYADGRTTSRIHRQPFQWYLPMGGLPKIQWYRGACPNLNNANRRLLKALLVHRRYVSKTRCCLCRLWDTGKQKFLEMD